MGKLLKWIIILNLIYLTLPVLFGIFPWTGGFSGKLISYFLNPIKHILISVWYYLPNFFTIIVLIIFFRYLLRILFYFKKEIERGALKIPGFYVDWANPTFQIIRVLVLAFALIIIFPYLPGSDSQVFKGVSVFLGVLFTFGSAGALSNVVAGLVLTYMRAYKIGDRVKIGDAVGDVVEKSLLVTRIKTIKNEIVSIPNSTVMNSHTTNFSAEAKEHGLIIHTTVTIGYEKSWRQIHDLLIKAALATELINKEPAPFVFQTSLDDFYVRYQINAYTNAPNEQQNTYSNLNQNIQDVFNEAGVEIMSAHYQYIRDGNQTTVPADHLPDDYVAPAFRVKTEGKE
jgi:small-conductance mechanosensitive channel